MGDTLPPSQEGACLGRSVTSWTSGSGLSPACSRARRWRRCAPSSGSPARPATRSYDRYKDCGVQAFTDRSRRPYRQANRLPPPIEATIVRLKREYPGWGAPKIREKLRQQVTAARSCPAISTVHAVLDRHGLVQRRRRRRHARRGHRRCRGRPSRTRCGVPTTKASSCSANRRYCYPLTITDFASRYLLTCEALSTTQEKFAFTVFERDVQGIRAAAARSAPTTACRSRPRTRSTG